MTELPYAIALVVAAAFGWDAFRRWSTLAHGRLVTHDKSQAHDRALTTLELRAKKHTEELAAAFSQLATQERRIDAAATRLDQTSARISSLEESFTGVAERSEKFGESLANFVNEARSEIEKIKEKETMALMGLNQIGSKGLRKAP